MFFLVRAAFWIGVVAVFMPGNEGADALTGTARAAMTDAAQVTSAEAYTAVADVCLGNPELCVAGADAIDEVQSLAVEGLTALAAAIDEEKVD